MASRAQSGMTLIELMIVVAIVAILAAIAYPSYQRYVTRTHRNGATACLSQYAQRLEQYYSANLTYVGVGATIPVTGLPCSRENTLDQRYTFTVRGVTANTYLLDATPIGTQLALDTQCGTLTLDQSGTRTVTGSGGRDQCWR